MLKYIISKIEQIWGGAIGDGIDNYPVHDIHFNEKLQDEFFEKIKLIFLEKTDTRKMSREQLCNYILNSKPTYDKNGNFVQFYVPHMYSYVTEIKKDYFIVSFDGQWCPHDSKFMIFNGNPKNWLCSKCFVDFVAKKDTRQNVESKLPKKSILIHVSITEKEILRLLQKKCTHANAARGIRSYGYCKKPCDCNYISGTERAELQLMLNELRGNTENTVY